MIRRKSGPVPQGCCGIEAIEDIADKTDRELLHRFATYGDQEAFATVVERYGSQVLSICYRTLRHAQDAEDAFQATFLVLARKAGSIDWQESVGRWLSEVAYRVASEARGQQSRRRSKVKALDPLFEVPVPAEGDQKDLHAALDRELLRLPAKYRLPLVLCYREGRSRDEAAQRLGLTPGTVKGRLERGRGLLRRRLVIGRSLR